MTETTYARGLQLPRHAHELAKYCFVLAGSFTETVGQRSAERQPLALIFHPSETTHEEANTTAGHHFLIEIDHRWLACAREYFAVLDQPLDLSGSASIGLATRLFDEFKHLDGLSPLAMEGVILELMANLFSRGENILPRNYYVLSKGDSAAVAQLWLRRFGRSVSPAR